MTENSHTSPNRTWWRGRAGAIARTLIAITTGVVAGTVCRDPEIGITAATGCLSLLQGAYYPKAR